MAADDTAARARGRGRVARAQLPRRAARVVAARGGGRRRGRRRRSAPGARRRRRRASGSTSSSSTCSSTAAASGETGLTRWCADGRAAGERPMFVLATAYEQHALEAFELGVVDYLLKPFSEERVVQCLRRLHQRRAGGGGSPSGPPRIVARRKRSLVFLEPHENLGLRGRRPADVRAHDARHVRHRPVARGGRGARSGAPSCACTATGS